MSDVAVAAPPAGAPAAPVSAPVVAPDGVFLIPGLGGTQYDMG